MRSAYVRTKMRIYHIICETSRSKTRNRRDSIVPTRKRKFETNDVQIEIEKGKEEKKKLSPHQESKKEDSTQGEYAYSRLARSGGVVAPRDDNRISESATKESKKAIQETNGKRQNGRTKRTKNEQGRGTRRTTKGRGKTKKEIIDKHGNLVSQVLLVTVAAGGSGSGVRPDGWHRSASRASNAPYISRCASRKYWAWVTLVPVVIRVIVARGVTLRGVKWTCYKA